MKSLKGTASSDKTVCNKYLVLSSLGFLFMFLLACLDQLVCMPTIHTHLNCRMTSPLTCAWKMSCFHARNCFIRWPQELVSTSQRGDSFSMTVVWRVLYTYHMPVIIYMCHHRVGKLQTMDTLLQKLKADDHRYVHLSNVC